MFFVWFHIILEIIVRNNSIMRNMYIGLGINFYSVKFFLISVISLVNLLQSFCDLIIFNFRLRIPQPKDNNFQTLILIDP